jgi:hypothetical protein
MIPCGEEGERMREWHSKSLGKLMVVVATALILFSCAGRTAKLTPATAPEKFDCVAENKLEKMITPEASLEEFSCTFKKYEGSDTLHFNVTLKNVSSQPQRFRVNIFLDNGKAVGGLLPVSTKGGLIEPGKTASFVYPVMRMAEQPEAVTIKVSTAGP